MSSRGQSTSVVLPSVSALGVVFGDIGTSPLYAMRECFVGAHAVAPTRENVLGVLSLIVYSLLVVISVKYVAVVMRADNEGEGGILALTALILPSPGSGVSRAALVLLGIFGAALLYGDGMITPAITVLGAVEGMTIATPLFDPYVVPVAIAILIAVFAIQRHGTHRVGALFGPVMAIWFVVLAVLGVRSIAGAPSVLVAFDPRYAVEFLMHQRWHGFAVLGAVFLVVTGGEALYADMGHFGTRPIRLAWFAVVLPALLLNYFGQGALILLDASAVEQPFFRLGPSAWLVPLVGLAAAAAVIASQALISGAFSLTHQAVQLGYSPRLTVAHTSSDEMGQVYVPQVNWLLAIGTVLIVAGFRSSSALAAAYGIAVTMTMIITAVLLYVVAVERWHWPRWIAGLVTGAFLTVDLAFFGANLLKVFQGGWLPLVIAGVLFAVMTTWKTGRRHVAERLTARAVSLDDFMASVVAARPRRVPGTAVFMTAQPSGTPPALVHNLRYNKMLHEHVILLTVATVRTPHVHDADRLAVTPLGHGVFSVRAQCGFMEDPDVPAIVSGTRAYGVPLDVEDLTYFLGRETIVASGRHGMWRWREHLFVFVSRNAVRATAYFRIPPERVVELGVQVSL